MDGYGKETKVNVNNRVIIHEVLLLLGGENGQFHIIIEHQTHNWE
jgi:hypothetical protein